MQYFIEFSDGFTRSMKKLKKKDPGRFAQIQKKLQSIILHPEHYKPLRNVLAGYRRIQFGPFVLIYTIRGNIIRIISLDRHDKAY
ncbi:MAG: type II toxin-antitoxin system RelE/ParE family toxin [DPANN group archaeon]|nr:type II toxin-antitoxin system RelE/ParE family toxin [DPANN group archaeon]